MCFTQKSGANITDVAKGAYSNYNNNPKEESHNSEENMNYGNMQTIYYFSVEIKIKCMIMQTDSVKDILQHKGYYDFSAHTTP